MTWLWTDDIARALLECEAVARSQVEDWIERPFAVFVAEGSDIVELGRTLLGATEAGAA
jgi:nucleoside diphosphate kinase